MYSRSMAINFDLRSAAAKAASSPSGVGSDNRPGRESSRQLQRFRASSKLGFVLAPMLVGGVASQPEPADNTPQQQSLAHQGHDDDTECDEENEIAVRKRRTDFCGQRNS